MDHDWFGYEGLPEEEMQQAMWDEDGPPTLEDENLVWVSTAGRISLMGRGGVLQHFEPDADLDAALVSICTKVMGD